MKYINGYTFKDKIILEYKENNTKKQEEILDFKWYFYIRKIDLIKIDLDKMKECGMIDDYIIGNEYIRLYSQNLNNQYEQDGKKAVLEYLKKEEIETYESDFDSLKRYCIDNKIEVDDNYDILYFDIETDDSNIGIVIGGSPMLTMAGIDSSGNKFYFSDKNEKVLLQNCLNLFKRYDIITGWNSSGFDIPYIKARMKEYKLRFNWNTIAHIDMMKRFISLFTLSKYSLDFVSNYFLKTGKIKHAGKRIIDMYKKEPELLKRYNEQDVQLLKDLDEKIDCFKLMIKEAKWCNTFMSKFYVSELLDNYLLKNAKEKNIICPSKKEFTKKKKYIGAIVLDPKRGLYDDVYVFDFSSLYPSIIMTSNIGFDTIDKNGEIKNPGSGFKFTNKKKSIVKETIEGMIGKRKLYKDQKLKMIEEGINKGSEFETISSNEYVVKALTNSIYGIMGMQQSRWYSVEIAESITKMGQWIITFTVEYFRIIGFDVIYGDTDSIFCVDNEKKDLKNNMNDILKQYHKVLKDELKQFGITDSKINLEDDKTFSKFLLVDKKNYTGIASSLNGKKTNELYTKGLDYIKRNTIRYASNKQKELIKHILFDNYNLDDCIFFIEECQREVIDGKLDIEDLIIRMKITKKIEEYQSKLPHVIVAEKIIKKTGLLQNYEIEYIVKDNISKDYIMVDEYEDKYDEYFYWNNRIFNILKRIVNVVFQNEDWERFYMKRISQNTGRKKKKNQLFLDF